MIIDTFYFDPTARTGLFCWMGLVKNLNKRVCQYNLFNADTLQVKMSSGIIKVHP